MNNSLSWLYTTQTAWRFAKSWWKWLLLALFANLLCALFEGGSIGLFAVALQVFGNSDLGGTLADLLGRMGRERLFLGLILLAVLCQLLRSAFQFLGVVLTAVIRPRVQARAMNQVYAHILRLDFSRASRFRLGDFTDCLQQPAHLNEAFARGNDLLRAFLFLLVYSAILFWLSWPMTLMALGLYGLISRLMGIVVRRVARHAVQVRQAQLEITQRAVESFQALRVLHSFDHCERSISDVSRSIERVRAGQARALLWSSTPEPLTDSLTALGVGLFIAVGTLLHGADRPETLPSLLAFLAAMHRVTPSLRALHAHRVALTNLAPNMARMNELLSLKPLPRRPGRSFRGISDSIEFERVGLHYFSHEAPAVSDLSFSVPRGSFTALVGLSGAGKSTVADLLLRLYEPTSGVIRVDGVEINALDPRGWLARVGSVSQYPFLFHATIRENILFGAPHADEEQMRWAAEAAHADGFIRKLADGYDTLVGERGQRLSGGEQQRIALARALIRQPDLLILDEATSALDSDSERQIQQALEEQRDQRTILAIAHRLSTVSHADQILVLSEGRLVEEGTHAELIGRGGVYAHLWRLQVEGERPSVALKEMTG